MHNYLKAPVFALTIAAMLTLVGCASPATSEGMLVENMKLVKQHPQTVNVTVSGGKETNPMWKSQIDDGAMRQALVDSIKQNRAFSQVIEGKNGDYQLDVTIFNVAQPNFGLDLKVVTEMGWTLTRVDTGVPVWREAITTEYTATFSDAASAIVRLRLANEGAARENIAHGLAKISALSL